MSLVSKPPVRAGALTLGYAIAVYLLMVAVLGYAAGFFAGYGVPRTIDRGPHAAWPLALAIDAALLLLFAVQHTVMARPWFKRRWTRLLPAPAERATFVLAASGALVLLMWLWRPVEPALWAFSGPVAAAVLAAQGAGWVLAVAATFAISNVDLFGLRQAYLYARGTPYRPPAFTERGLYGRVRHPLMAGFLVIFWAAPRMTLGHLVFAAAATGYIAVGIAFEERDAIAELGDTYRGYLARVPALFPVPGYRGGRRARALRSDRLG